MLLVGQGNKHRYQLLGDTQFMTDTAELIHDVGDICTWQDVSEMIDYVSLFITKKVMILGFSIFLLCAKFEAN